MTRKRYSLWPISLVLVSVSAFAATPDDTDTGLPLQGSEAETFLREAEIVARKEIGVGITRPQKVTLSDGVRTHFAVWKTVDEYRSGVVRGRRGGFQVGVWDSYRYEVAAYELDKILGLGIVPPTVEREIGGKRGSLQMWVEGGVTELDRRDQSLEAPDPIIWTERLAELRLFQSLVYDSDYLNIRNILYDSCFRVYSIDHSRAFRSYSELLQEERLLFFSRTLLGTLEALTSDELESRLGTWLSKSEISGLLGRRDKILTRSAELVSRLGEDTVLYP